MFGLQRFYYVREKGIDVFKLRFYFDGTYCFLTRIQLVEDPTFFWYVDRITGLPSKYVIYRDGKFTQVITC